jgi:predicted phosphodiesterase
MDVDDLRLRIMSDLHLEFHADAGRSFIESLNPSHVDALILAGDLSTVRGIAEALERLCDIFPVVVYVHGNHEFYNSNRPRVLEVMKEETGKLPNLIWLEKGVAELEGHRILGAPLWFKRDDKAPKYEMNDFNLIEDFEEWVYDENRQAVRFLRRELAPGDVVVTHHLPSKTSIAPEYKDDPLNAYFFYDLEELIIERKPAVWIHGHTHTSFDYKIVTTRVVCNPFGYAGQGQNSEFDMDKTIEI